MAIAQFTIRKIDGVTDIKLADDPKLRAEICKAMARYAPLLEESDGSPKFEDLKRTREAAEFAGSECGRQCTITLQVRGSGKTIMEKAVLFVDGESRIRGISRWTPEGGVAFCLPN